MLTTYKYVILFKEKKNTFIKKDVILVKLELRKLRFTGNIKIVVLLLTLK